MDRSSTNRPLALGVFTSTLSTPAVLLPWFCCVTRRTLVRRLEYERSISFWRDRTFRRSPICEARKIRWRRRRTCALALRQLTLFQSVRCRGPFAGVSVCVKLVPCLVVVPLPFGVHLCSRQP